MNYYVYLSQINVYRQPTFHSEVDTQAVCGEQLTLIKENGDFLEVTCADGYQGWVNRHQVSDIKPPTTDTRLFGARFIPFYREPDTGAPIVGSAGAGGQVYVLDDLGAWLKIFLPHSGTAFMRAELVAPLLDFSAGNIIETAQRFLGVPYLWGGKTPTGLDCSGFVQLVHKLLGNNIRRDAWMQQADATPTGNNYESGQPGELMFFAESGTKTTHVGFCLGQGRLLHARGFVRVNSLREGDPDYSAGLVKSYVGNGTFL